MDTHSLLSIGLIMFSLLAIAVLSGSESSIIAVNKVRIRNLAEKGDKRAMAVQRLLSNYDKFFSAIILSGNLFTILATSIATSLALSRFGEYGVTVATVILTFLIVIFGELTPKTFAVTFSEQLALMLARPIELYIKIVTPLMWIFHSTTNFILGLFNVKEAPTSPFVTEEEIKTMLKIGQEEGTIEEDEGQMLDRVFEFGDKMVSEAMVPRTEIIGIPFDDSVKDALKLVAEHGYSRYPVIEETVDNITGILYVKDIIIKMAEHDIQDLKVADIMREAYYIPENKMVTELLDEMQKKKFQIAIVMDEHGGTAGLLTLEDIMEEIVGGLQDEFEAIEAERDIEIIDEHTFIVTGTTGLDEVNELVGAGLQSGEFHTIGGFVFGLFGRLAKVGEQVRYHNLRFLILDMEDRKISRLKISRL